MLPNCIIFIQYLLTARVDHVIFCPWKILGWMNTFPFTVITKTLRTVFAHVFNASGLWSFNHSVRILPI